MSGEQETQKICNITDEVTKIRYKIIYRRSANRYEIWTQFHDANGKLRRNRITFNEALAVESDCDKTIAYVNDYLVANHINIYEGIEPANKGNKTESKAQNTLVKKPIVDGTPIIFTYKKHNCKDLEQLFSIWQKAQAEEPDSIWVQTRGSAANITKNHFRRDGIIDTEIFAQEDRKILFISSEANDDEYSAKTNSLPSTVDDYIKYHITRQDDWKGKMRERLAEIYKVLTHTERKRFENPDAVLHFAVMDINKRGGGALIGNDNHVENYCKTYAPFIREEIEIINPDVAAVIGTNLFNANLHGKYLGAIAENGKDFFMINGKKIPILSLWQTSYYQGRCDVAKGYEDNRIIGKQVFRTIREMEKYGL